MRYATHSHIDKSENLLHNLEKVKEKWTPFEDVFFTFRGFALYFIHNGHDIACVGDSIEFNIDACDSHGADFVLFIKCARSPRLTFASSENQWKFQKLKKQKKKQKIEQFEETNLRSQKIYLPKNI